MIPSFFDGNEIKEVESYFSDIIQKTIEKIIIEEEEELL